MSLGCKTVTSQRQIVRASYEGESIQVPLGETGRVNNLAVTIAGVRTTNAHDEEVKNLSIRIPDPAEGHVYMMVNLSLENIGEDSEAVSSRQQINLFDADHELQEWSLIAISKGTINGKIGPGQERRGELVWQVSEDAKGLTLVFGDTVFAIGDVGDFRPGAPIQ